MQINLKKDEDLNATRVSIDGEEAGFISDNQHGRMLAILIGDAATRRHGCSVYDEDSGQYLVGDLDQLVG